MPVPLVPVRASNLTLVSEYGAESLVEATQILIIAAASTQPFAKMALPSNMAPDSPEFSPTAVVVGVPPLETVTSNAGMMSLRSLPVGLAAIAAASLLRIACCCHVASASPCQLQIVTVLVSTGPSGTSHAVLPPAPGR